VPNSTFGLSHFRVLGQFDEKESNGDTPLAQNDLLLAKRKRTLLESNPPRKSQLETHRDDEAGAARVPFPDRFQQIGSKDSRCLKKLIQ